MGLLHGVRHLIVPFVCLFTIPLAFLAGFTTVIAFGVLLFRIASVYLEIALNAVPQCLMGKSRSPLIRPTDLENRKYSPDGLKTPVSPTASFASASIASGYSTPSPGLVFPSTPAYGSSGYISPHRRRNSFIAGPRRSRRSSQVSLGSMTSIPPIHEGEPLLPTIPLEACLTPSVGLDRDFEGVGGWRLSDDEDSAEWTKINSRLDLGFERVSSYPRHHPRPYTGPAGPPSEGAWLSTINARVPESRDFDFGRRAPVSPNNGRVGFTPTVQVQAPGEIPDKDPYHRDSVSPKTTKKPPRNF
jgi:hypothetical protein